MLGRGIGSNESRYFAFSASSFVSRTVWILELDTQKWQNGIVSEVFCFGRVLGYHWERVLDYGWLKAFI